MKPGYITMNPRQCSNLWNDGRASHTAPKIPSAKILSEICSLFTSGGNTTTPNTTRLPTSCPEFFEDIWLMNMGPYDVP